MMSKNLPASAGDTRNVGSIPGSKRSPGGRNDNPVFLPGKVHGQGSLVGYSPWNHKELDPTEQLTLTPPSENRPAKLTRAGV